MSKFTYTPPPGEPDEITAFGQAWKAGKTVDLKDEGWLTVAMGHPFFVRKDSAKDDEQRVADAPQVGQEKPDTRGPARPVPPERDPLPGAIPGPKPGDPAPGQAAK